jgi:hypothetical protein
MSGNVRSSAGESLVEPVNIPVMHSAQRALELEVELLVVEKLPPTSLLSQSQFFAQNPDGLHRA